MSSYPTSLWIIKSSHYHFLSLSLLATCTILYLYRTPTIIHQSLPLMSQFRTRCNLPISHLLQQLLKIVSSLNRLALVSMPSTKNVVTVLMLSSWLWLGNLWVVPLLRSMTWSTSSLTWKLIGSSSREILSSPFCMLDFP